MAKSQKLGLENIMQSWSILLPGQAKRRDDFFAKVREEFTQRVSSVEVTNLVVGSIPFLQIVYGSFHCNIFAIIFGTDVYISWDMQSPKLTPSKIPGVVGALANSFKSFSYSEVQVASAFGAVVLDCVRTAAEKITEGSEKDKAKLAKQSSGLLGAI